MSRPEVDPKRTGVKAREVPDMGRADERARFCGEPGDMVRAYRHNATDLLWGFNVACPGCGQFAAVPTFPTEGARWEVTGGSVEDVTTLTLSPSILKDCCGWHGHLRAGVFESC